MRGHERRAGRTAGGVQRLASPLVTLSHVTLSQRDTVTLFRIRTVIGRLGGLHQDCYFVTRLFAISSSHGSLGSKHFATLLLFSNFFHRLQLALTFLCQSWSTSIEELL